MREQQEKDKRILLNNYQRIRLAAKAKQLTRRLLEETTVLFTPDTILGIKPKPNGPWMEQIARNLTWEDSFLEGKEYLIHDRDPLYTGKFVNILRSAGVEPVKPPPRSPNLNAYAERFVRSVKEECLNKLILSSEQLLHHVLSEYLKYYHHERIHQGINRIIEPRHKGNDGEIICIERLGGLLKSYHRKVA